MSEDNAVDQEAKELSTGIGKAVEEAGKLIAGKFGDKLQDIVVILNWKPEYHDKPVPKMLVNTLRDVNGKDFNPTQQVLEISGLLQVGSDHILRQFISQLLTANAELQNRLQGQEVTKPKLIVPN